MRQIIWTFILLSPVIALAREYHWSAATAPHAAHIALHVASKAIIGMRTLLT